MTCKECWWYGKPIECPADFNLDTHECKNFKPSLVQRKITTELFKVEVVRCKDCRYYETDKWDDEILCGCNNPSGMQDVSADGYCSYGERKEGADYA